MTSEEKLKVTKHAEHRRKKIKEQNMTAVVRKKKQSSCQTTWTTEFPFVKGNRGVSVRDESSLKKLPLQ